MTIFQWKKKVTIEWMNHKKCIKAANNNIGFRVSLSLFFFYHHPPQQMTKFSNKSETLSEQYVFHSLVLFLFGWNSSVLTKIKSFPLDCMFAFENGKWIRLYSCSFFFSFAPIHCVFFFALSIKSVLKRRTRSITTNAKFDR